MSDYQTTDIIAYSIEQKPIEFENAFKSLIQDRLVDAVHAKKLELAKTLFNRPENVDLENDIEQDTEEDQDA